MHVNVWAWSNNFCAHCARVGVRSGEAGTTSTRACIDSVGVCEGIKV